METMKITGTILTRMAEAQSAHAAYHLEYNITDGMLERVQATVYRLSENEQRAVIGSVYYDRGSVTANMPFCREMHLYVGDFCGYVEEILEQVKQETKQ